jgi:SulP family sulfate permease
VIPATTWLAKYEQDWLAADLAAGLTAAARAPAPVIAVAGAIAASFFLGLEAAGVGVVGALSAGLPPLSMPDRNLLLGMWPAAVGIALMSFTESIAAARAFRREGDARVESNQELVATGMANLVSDFFGAMPSGGGTSQTAVNATAGARSQLSGLVVAAISLATMLFLAPLISRMPHATLAAVVIVYSVGRDGPAYRRTSLFCQCTAGGRKYSQVAGSQSAEGVDTRLQCDT